MEFQYLQLEYYPRAEERNSIYFDSFRYVRNQNAIGNITSMFCYVAKIGSSRLAFVCDFSVASLQKFV